jgi:hypothetical protein
VSTPRDHVARGAQAFAAALLVFGLLTAVVHRGLVARAGDAIYAPPPADPAAGPPIGNFARGDQLLHVWALATNLRHLHGEATFFDANAYWPMPRALFFSDHLFGEALAVWPLSLVVGNPLLLHNLALLASFVLCGAGTALVVRALGGGLLAGLVAGVAWTFGPARGFEVFQLQLLTAQWIPFLVLAIHRTFARPGWRPALAVAALLALQLLSGIYVGTYLVLALAAFVPVLALVTPAPGRSLVLVALAGVAAVGANVPWLATYLEVRSALGEYGGLLENVAYALSLQHWCLPTWAIGGGRFPGPLGVTLAALALAGALVRRGGRARLAYAATAAWTIALSLGPYVRWGASPATAHGPGFLGPGPYAALHALVPGLEALRVPARMSLVAGFFVAVLAGLGAGALLRRLRRPAARAAVAAALAALVFVEARFATPALEPLAPPPAVYGWLREHGPGEPMVELPMNALRDPLYLAYSTVHWRPIVNGYGAYLPEPYLHLQQLLDRFPAPATLAALRAIDVRHVVTHGLPPVAAEGVAAVATFGDDRVYAVLAGPLPEPHDTPGLRRLARDGWRGRGGADAADAPAAYDGDPHTAWSNVGALTADLGWLSGIDGWGAWERAYALRDRPQRFVLDLGRTVTPARVEVLLRTHQSPVFAPFTLETSPDGTTWTAVPCPWRPAADLRSFAARPADTRLAVTCDYPSLRHLRIVQAPARFRIYWELAEVDVLLPAGSGPLPGHGGP